MRVLRATAKVNPEPLTLTSPPGVDLQPVFGVSLETLREDGQMVCGIPLVLRQMVEFLEKNGKSFFPCFVPRCPRQTCQTSDMSLTGMEHRGLFRLCGSVVRIRQLRQQWDRGEKVDLQEEGDVHAVASLLKLFFRELPCPIIPHHQCRQLFLSFSGTREKGKYLIFNNFFNCITHLYCIYSHTAGFKSYRTGC